MKVTGGHGTAMEVNLHGEEASLFIQLLIELANYERNPNLGSPVHLGLVMLKKLEREGEAPINLDELGAASSTSRSYGYEDAYVKLRSWLVEQPDPWAGEWVGPNQRTYENAWERYKSFAGIKERGSEACDATEGSYFCVLPPGHEGIHRWARSR
jgi:hypothetical protein